MSDAGRELLARFARESQDWPSYRDEERSVLLGNRRDARRVLAEVCDERDALRADVASLIKMNCDLSAARSAIRCAMRSAGCHEEPTFCHDHAYLEGLGDEDVAGAARLTQERDNARWERDNCKHDLYETTRDLTDEWERTERERDALRTINVDVTADFHRVQNLLGCAEQDRDALRAALQALVEAVDADGLRRHFPQLGRARWAYRAACDALKSAAADEPR